MSIGVVDFFKKIDIEDDSGNGFIWVIEDFRRRNIHKCTAVEKLSQVVDSGLMNHLLLHGGNAVGETKPRPQFFGVRGFMDEIIRAVIKSRDRKRIVVACRHKNDVKRPT